MDEQPEVVERVRVGLIEKASTDLARLDKATGLGRTNVINRAIQVYAFIQAEIAAGNTLVVRHPDGSGREVHIS